MHKHVDYLAAPHPPLMTYSFSLKAVIYKVKSFINFHKSFSMPQDAIIVYFVKIAQTSN